jgi:hypothetical protein
MTQDKVVSARPYVVLHNKRRWSTVEFDLDSVWCNLTQKGLDAYSGLVDEYIKDKKIKGGAGWGLNHGMTKVRVEHAEDFAKSLVRIFNELGNIASELRNSKIQLKKLARIVNL